MLRKAEAVSKKTVPLQGVTPCATVQLPSKTRRFFVEFRELSRVRSTESSGFMERAMGVESTSEV